VIDIATVMLLANKNDGVQCTDKKVSVEGKPDEESADTCAASLHKPGITTNRAGFL